MRDLLIKTFVRAVSVMDGQAWGRIPREAYYPVRQPTGIVAGWHRNWRTAQLRHALANPVKPHKILAWALLSMPDALENCRPVADPGPRWCSYTIIKGDKKEHIHYSDCQES